MSEINLELFKKQMIALNTDATEVLYGGAAGGGKSHLMRIAAITWCSAIPGLQVYLFRRVRDDLIKTHLDSPKGFRNLLAPWADNKWVKIKEDVIEFWNGSRIYLCHCQHETDVGKYLSAEFHVLLIDELTTFSENMYRQLRARVRMVGVKVPEQYQGQFPRILCGSNPGNVGHLFVKDPFVDNVEPLTITKASPEEGGMMRQYIPARVNDNPALLAEDPNYIDKLKGIGSDALVRAMLEGDWNIVEGAFFDCWSDDKHIVKPFRIPDQWMRFMSGDWGSRKPFAFHWFAVCSDDTQIKSGQIIPRGALIVYKEWYGSPAHKDVGLKLTAEEVGSGLKERIVEPISYSVLDPAAFNQDGGPSIAERMYAAGGPMFVRADNKRIARKGAMGGWDIVRARLVGEEHPMIFFFSNCVDIIRTLPAMQHDQNNPEDLNCWVGSTLVATPDGGRFIKEIEVGSMVDTPIGPREVLQSYKSGAGKTKIITLEDGTILQGTPDHKVYVEGKGLLSLEDLSCYDILLQRNTSWQQKLLNTMVSSTKDMKVEDITIQTEPILQKATNLYTDKFGWIAMAPLPKVCTSTTSTITGITTISPTLNVVPLSTTSRDILRKSKPQRKLWRDGGLRMKGRLLYPKMPERCLSEHQKSSCRAEIVENLLKLKSMGKNTAENNAPIFSRVNKSIKSVLYAILGFGLESIKQKKSKRVATIVDGPSEEVYNLTVADANLFYANSILSSNTSMEDHAVDSVRYGCMSRPYVAGKPHTEKKLLHKSTFNDIMRQNRNTRGTNRGYV